MGLFGSLLGMAGGMIGEQLWPEYERIVGNSYGAVLEDRLQSEERGSRKAIYLLALGRNNPSLAQSYYMEEKTRYDSIFRNLSNYYKFKREIEDFYRKIRY